MKRIWFLCAALLSVVMVACSPNPPPEVTFQESGGRLLSEPTFLPITLNPQQSWDRENAVVNPQRGQYLWLNGAPVPGDWPVIDVYYRDQIQWKEIETNPGVYDFSIFDTGLAEAESRGGKFHFRIMAFCPECGGNLTPDWIPRQMNGAPAWNDGKFLAAWSGLVRALGDHLANDPRLGFVDIGGYGAYGEWLHTPEVGSRITDKNAEQIIRAVLESFPDSFVLINWMLSYPEMATSMSDRVGIRNDCLGGFEQDRISTERRVQQVWRRAPLVSEWCPRASTTADLGLPAVKNLHLSMVSSGNHPKSFDQMGPNEQALFKEISLVAGYRYSLQQFSFGAASLAAQQVYEVESTWRNSGTAPTYDDWDVFLQFTSQSGATNRTKLHTSLRTVAEGQVTATDSVLMPNEPGVYQVSMVLLDPEGYMSPMYLAQHGRQPDGTYSLGTVEID